MNMVCFSPSLDTFSTVLWKCPNSLYGIKFQQMNQCMANGYIGRMKLHKTKQDTKIVNSTCINSVHTRSNQFTFIFIRMFLVSQNSA